MDKYEYVIGRVGLTRNTLNLVLHTITKELFYVKNNIWALFELFSYMTHWR